MRRITLLLLSIILLLQGCTMPFFNDKSRSNIKLERDIPALNLHRSILDSVPLYDEFSPESMQVDLRGYDLTNLQIFEYFEDLIHADFDTRTKWPYWLPENFDPKKILEYGKNPGLNIKELHKKGITGKGVSIAIIDDVLLPDHSEYIHALRYYKEIPLSDKEATVSGCQLASITAGKTTGVAPESDLYYIAENHQTDSESDSAASYYSTDRTKIYHGSLYGPLEEAIDKIISINRSLSDENRIRAICIGKEISANNSAYFLVEEAIMRAQSEGIFVISNLLYETSQYEMDFNGLGRDPLKDPDLPDSYEPASNFIHSFFTFGRYVKTNNGLLVPMDSKCTAAPTGKNDYAFYRQNSKNICLAYITGIYALACQVNPDITPTDFWNAALETGDALIFEKNNISFLLKRIINPDKLMREINK